MLTNNDDDNVKEVELESLTVGPFSAGLNLFPVTAPAPNLQQMTIEEMADLSAINLDIFYKGQPVWRTSYLLRGEVVADGKEQKQQKQPQPLTDAERMKQFRQVYRQVYLGEPAPAASSSNNSTNGKPAVPASPDQLLRCLGFAHSGTYPVNWDA